MIEGWLLLLLMLVSAFLGLGTGYVIHRFQARETKRCAGKVFQDTLDSLTKRWVREQTRADICSELCRLMIQWEGMVVLDEHAKSFEALRDKMRSAVRKEWFGPDLDGGGS